MEKAQIYLTVANEAFIQNIKNSLLLALLEENYISRWEYESCKEKLKGIKEEL